VPFRSLEGQARELLREKGLEVASPYRARRLLRQAVEEVLKPSDPQGLAAALEPSVRALLRGGVPLEGEEKVPERAARVVRVARRYQALLREKGLLDPSEVLAEAGRLGAGLTLRVLGYPYLGAGELAFLRGSAAPGSQVELPLPSTAWGEVNRKAKEALEGAGLQVREASLSPLARAFLEQGEPTGYQIKALRFPDMEGEVRYVLAQVKGLLKEGVAPWEIALVVRDDRLYGPLAAAVAFEQGLHLHLLYRIPLGETRVGGFLALLAEVLPDFPYEATLRLLFHPFFPREGGLDLDRIRRLRPHGREEWQKVGLPPALQALPEKGTGSELAEALRAFLLPLRQRLRGWPRERVALEAALGGLRELEEEKGLEGFRSGLAELLLHLTAPVQPGRGGVELHTPLARYGGQYSHLFVLGMAEGITPPPLGEDPLLGFPERRALRELGFPLEEPWEEAAREALVFTALLGSVVEDGEVVFSYPEVVGQDRVPESPYLGRLRLEPGEPERLLLGSRVELRRRRLWEQDPLQEEMEQARKAEEDRRVGRPSPYNGHTGAPYLPEVHVRTLRELAVCPFRFFKEHLLRPRGDGEAGDGGEVEEGGFLHEILARLFQEALSSGLAQGKEVRARAQVRLETVFTQVEEEWRNREDSPYFLRRSSWRHRRRELLRLLEGVLQDDGFLPDEAQVEAVGEKVQGEVAGIRVSGRLDRRDSRGGAPFLLDYTTGHPPKVKDPSGALKLDFEIPLYLLLKRLNGEGAHHEGAYYHLREGLVPIRRREDTLANLEEVLRHARGRMEEGFFPPEPDSSRWACRRCQASILCRVQVRNS
jgi:RecB family exonuclease